MLSKVKLKFIFLMWVIISLFLNVKVNHDEFATPFNFNILAATRERKRVMNFFMDTDICPICSVLG